MATTAPQLTSQEQKKQVIAALEAKDFTWRTMGGIAQATGISEMLVRKILGELQSEGIAFKSSVNAADGSELYTTRDHYRQTTSFWRRFMSALWNHGN